jgi:hypothetical protein
MAGAMQFNILMNFGLLAGWGGVIMSLGLVFSRTSACGGVLWRRLMVLFKTDRRRIHPKRVIEHKALLN